MNMKMSQSTFLILFAGLAVSAVHAQPGGDISLPVLPSCTTDAECPVDQWCRPLSSVMGAEMTCYPYSFLNERCTAGSGGRIDPSNEIRCHPSLACAENPMAPDLSGICQATLPVEPPTESECRTDNECSDDTWCRPVDESGSGINACVPYNLLGMSCGEFQPPSFQTRCHPSLMCTQEDGALPDLPGVCESRLPVEPPIPSECTVDSDCSEVTWCRPVDESGSGINACVPYNMIGMTCGGFQLPSFQTRCHPSLVCNKADDALPDSPGVCEPTLPVEPPAPSECAVDSDCANGKWCQSIDETGDLKACVPYRVDGEECSGFVPEFMQSRCEPSLVCQPDVVDAMLSLDGPGHCVKPQEEIESSEEAIDGNDGDNDLEVIVESNKLSSGAVAGAVVAGVVLIGALVAIAVLFVVRSGAKTTSGDYSTNKTNLSGSKVDVETGR